MTEAARIHTPGSGWGEVTDYRVPLMWSLYQEGPRELVFVRWESGGGGWVDPNADGVSWRNAGALASLIR